MSTEPNKAQRRTAFELHSGARTAKQKAAINGLLDAIPLLSFGPEEAQVAAEIRQQLERQGQAIGMADYMIGAVRVVNGGVLLTRNREHFERVEGLKLSHVTGG